MAAALLAAGRGVRWTGPGPKLLAPCAGRPLVAHAIDALAGAGLAPALVVVGTVDDPVAALVPSPLEAVVSPRHADGIAWSLRAALTALTARADVDGVVIGLGDQPLVGAAAYRRLADAYDADALVVATYGGRRGNPVLVPRSRWGEAARLDGDEGARALFRGHRVVEVACDGTGRPDDVDTPADLAAVEPLVAAAQD